MSVRGGELPRTFWPTSKQPKHGTAGAVEGEVSGVLEQGGGDRA